LEFLFWKAAGQQDGGSWGGISGVLGALGAVLEASWALLGRSWRPLGALEAFWALSGRYWKPLGRSWDGLGGILGTLGPELRAFRELLGPSWERLESSWGRLGGILSALGPVLGAFCRSCDFHCFFFNGFHDIFEVPRPVLEASWRSSRHLGPLGGLLERLERILRALGGLLERLGRILSALRAILDPSWQFFLVDGRGTCMDLHGPAWKHTLPRAGSAAVGGPSEEGGATLKGFSSQWSG